MHQAAHLSQRISFGIPLMLGALLLSLLFTQSTHADQRVLTYSGFFDYVHDPEGNLPSQLKLGTSFQVTLTLDDSVEQRFDDALAFTPMIGYSLEIDPFLQLIFGTVNLGFSLSYVVVGNDLNGGSGGSGIDTWQVQSLATLAGGGGLTTGLVYSDSTSTALQDDDFSVPSDVDFADWDNVSLLVTYRGLGRVESIAVGTIHPEPNSGKVTCWGADYLDQASPPTSVDGTSGYANAIGSGFAHTCASQAGTWGPVCWGADDFGQASPPPSQTALALRNDTIDAGGRHTCMIERNQGEGIVLCWGSDEFGQTSPPASIRGNLPGDAVDTAVSVATGAFHSCAIQWNTDAVVCWGRNDFGEATPPASIDGSNGSASSIAAGYAHTCAVQESTGHVICWGRNDFGEASPPDSVNGTTGIAVTVTAGDSHSCAIQAGNNKVVCWGDDTDGRATPPSSVNGVLGGATELVAGDRHTCAIQSGNRGVVCWGSNGSGQILVPGAVNGTLGTAMALAAGSDHTCAIQSPDLDGISVETEQGAPNGGDGNGDGMPDAEQSKVVSLPDASAEDYVTLEVSEGCSSVEHVSVSPEVINGQFLSGGSVIPERAADPEHDYPFGLVGFTLPCEGPVTMKLYFHAAEELSPPYRKHGPTVPGDFETMGWFTLPNVLFGSEIVGGNSVATVQYTLSDGALGDTTGVDGQIVDPAGPVPEPGSALSLLSGLVVLLALSRRRNPGPRPSN